MNRDEQINITLQDVYTAALRTVLPPPDVLPEGTTDTALGWTKFYNTKVAEAAVRIAKKEIEDEWSPEFIADAASDDVAAFKRMPNASQIVHNLTIQATRKGISEVAKKYALLLAPEWKPDSAISIDNHETALSAFNTVYRTVLAKLSVRDPKGWTGDEPVRKPGVRYPEEVAYEEGEKAYYKKLAELMGTGGGRKRRRKTRKVAGKRRRKHTRARRG